MSLSLAVIPAIHFIFTKGPLGELLRLMNRHNMRPSHLHIVVQAPGYHKLVTMFYPEDCPYIQSDSIFAAKKSLAVVCVPFFSLGTILTRIQYIATRSG